MGGAVLPTLDPLESSTAMESGYFKCPVWEGRVLSGTSDYSEAISSLQTPGAFNHSLGDTHLSVLLSRLPRMIFFLEKKKTQGSLWKTTSEGLFQSPVPPWGTYLI